MVKADSLENSRGDKSTLGHKFSSLMRILKSSKSSLQTDTIASGEISERKSDPLPNRSETQLDDETPRPFRLEQSQNHILQENPSWKLHEINDELHLQLSDNMNKTQNHTESSTDDSETEVICICNKSNEGKFIIECQIFSKRQHRACVAPDLASLGFHFFICRECSTKAIGETSWGSTRVWNPFAEAAVRKRAPETYGWDAGHSIVKHTDEDMLTTIKPLGHGALGMVEEVQRKGTQKPTVVRKSVLLCGPSRQRNALLRIVVDEAERLQSLDHRHIVSLIGSYEDKRQRNRHYYCLLMCPVGENDLRTFLDELGESATSLSEWRTWLRPWFRCLASALVYMHNHGVRHQDIKPSNIIHKGSQIYYTDFSSPAMFEVGRTTSTENPARASPMYAAPEVMNRSGDLSRHGRNPDIFALGCVFCDMITALEVHDFLSSDDMLGTTSATLHYSEKLPAIEHWFRATQSLGSQPSMYYAFKDMLRLDRSLRPSAAEVFKELMTVGQTDSSCPCW